jgi:hypothetical protein
MQHEWERRETCKHYWWESQKERCLGRSRHRWVDNIKMDLGEIKSGGVDWIGLAQDMDKWRALVNAVINLLVPLNTGKRLCGYTTGGLSRSAQLHRVS